jgi:hypothetical protein
MFQLTDVVLNMLGTLFDLISAAANSGINTDEIRPNSHAMFFAQRSTASFFVLAVSIWAIGDISTPTVKNSLTSNSVLSWLSTLLLGFGVGIFATVLLVML